MEEQQLDLLHHTEVRSDSDYQVCEQHIHNMHRQQVHSRRLVSFRALSYQPENFNNTIDMYV